MIAAASVAGEALIADFERLGEIAVVEKGPADFVSAADLRSQRTIAETLGRAFPDIAFLGEEGGDNGAASAGRRFVVDPLDGTTNFLHGIPHFAIAIALEEDGVPVVGLVLDPSRRELFIATRGDGAFVERPGRGRQALVVSTRAGLRDAVVATGIPHRARGDHPGYLRALARFMDEAGGIRRFGSAALDLAYVAAGRFDLFFESGLARWDIAAGSLLVEEAGGTVSGDIIATNGLLHGAVEGILRDPL